MHPPPRPRLVLRRRPVFLNTVGIGVFRQDPDGVLKLQSKNVTPPAF
ncbi:hypothetical protein GGD55_002679 [Rhizobium giardinii]|uniref:Uncharacterized protein n=1 Tax=Rhizobium giardinii TaxID=56731 RepID=A0A7W8UAS8_9HYPH|nr:hypothetical protein [Rhizobium giardinii]